MAEVREGGAGLGLVSVHNVVGTLVVLAYLVVTIVNIVRVTGREVPAGRTLSFAAAALLLIQYLIGFWLLGQGYRNQPAHFVVALLALVTVGLEHGYAPGRSTPRARAMTALIASVLTLVLVGVAHGIGSAGS